MGTAELDQGWALLQVQPFVPRRETLGKMCIRSFKLLPIHMLATFSFLSICIWAKLERNKGKKRRFSHDVGRILPNPPRM